MKTLKPVRVMAMVLVLAVIGVACEPSGTPSGSPGASPAGSSATRSGGVLRFAASAGDLGNLDPHFAATTQDRSVVDMVFNALLRFKPGDGTVFEPDLATSLPQPKLEGGKQSWTFSLRKGLNCQATDQVPSYELTSDDVLYSLQKAADPKRSAYAASYAGMTFEAVDPYTVKVTTPSPLSTTLFYPLVANYSGGFILCKKAAEQLGPIGLKTRPVGTGPFMFKSYSPQDRLELVANGAYFRGKPQLDGVEFRYIADANSRELGLRAGQFDVIYGEKDEAWIDAMERVSNVKVDVFGVGESSTILFNISKPPFDKLQVRQAVAYALSRDEVLALFGATSSEKQYSFLAAQFMPGGLTQAEVVAKGLEYKTDVEKAKKLLAEAGFPNGFALELVSSELPGYLKVYQSMQAQLGKVGIKISLKVVDHSSYHALIRTDVNALVVYAAYRPTSDIGLTQFFHSDSIVVTGLKPNTNFSHYQAIDKLIEQARVEIDSAKQLALWKETQVKILEDMVNYPILFTNQVYVRSTVVNYGHELKSVLALYPGVDETTSRGR